MKKNPLPMNENAMIERLQNTLTALRRLRGWTMQDLGDRIGVSKQTIGNIECGRTPLSKSFYILIRMAFQSSLYELADLDSAWFSYLVETILDPQTDTNLVDGLNRGIILGMALAKTDKSINPFETINSMVPGTLCAVSTHRVKYTSDPDGLDWYYDLIGVDRNLITKQEPVVNINNTAPMKEMHCDPVPSKKRKSRRIDACDSEQPYVTPNLVVMSEFARRAGITIGVLRTKITNGDIPTVKVDEHPSWIYIDTKYIDMAKPDLIDKDDYITVAEFANRFHCTNSAVSGFISTGSLAAKKISEGVSNFWLISKAYIDKLTGEEYSLSDFYAVKAIARDFNVNYVKLGDAVVAKRIPGVQLVDASGYVHKFIAKDVLSDKRYINVIESCR